MDCKRTFDHDLAKAMLRSGLKPKEISSRLSTPLSTVCNMFVREGLVRQKIREEPAYKKTAVEMYRDGLTVEQISLLLDIPESKINYTFVKLGITKADSGRRIYELWAEKLIAAEEAAKQGVVK